MGSVTFPHEVEGWYAWRCEHWGTKWEPAYSSMSEGTDECYMEIDFDTAWSPPTPFFQALADKFPKATITLLYYEGGCDFSGVDVWENGVHTEHEPEPGISHGIFLNDWNWDIALQLEEDDDRDYELDGEDYEDDDDDDDEPGLEAPIEWGGDSEWNGVTFAELAGDDTGEEEEEEGEKVEQVSSLQQWADD